MGMCKSVVGSIIEELSKEGCAAIIGEGDALCEAAGLGPEDPLADICAVIVTTGCEVIAEDVAKGVKDPEEMCSQLGKCGLNGSSCGCVKDDQCADSTGDCCSGKRHHTAACPSNIRCGCLPDGACAGSDGANGCCSGHSHRTAACGSNIRCGNGLALVESIDASTVENEIIV